KTASLPDRNSSTPRGVFRISRDSVLGEHARRGHESSAEWAVLLLDPSLVPYISLVQVRHCESSLRFSELGIGTRRCLLPDRRSLLLFPNIQVAPRARRYCPRH